MLHLLAAVTTMLLAAGGERPWVDAQPGIRVSMPITLAAAGRGPSIAPFGDAFVAAWLQPDPDDRSHRRACVVGLHLTAEGRPAAKARVLHCAQDMGPPTAVAADGRVAVVWGVPNQIEARILLPDLSPAAELHQSIPRIPDHVSASHDGSAFVAAWSTYDEAAALSFGPDGAILRGGPVQVSRRSDQSDVSNADVACVSSGVCAVMFRQFSGNSRTSAGSVRLEGGSPKGGFGGHSGPFDHQAIAGAGRLFTLYSTYDRLWGEDVLAGNAHVFDYQTSEHRIRDIAGAIGLEGTLLAWWMEPRQGARAGTSIAYVHPDPGAARPHPLPIPDAISPAVATRDGRRFILLTGTSGMRAVHSRLVEVDPSKFSSSPAQRGAAFEGVVQDPDGKPATAARVTYYLFLRDGSLSSGTTTVDQEGRFSIRHPRSNDLRTGVDVTRVLCWAQREGSASLALDQKPTGNPVTLQLQPEAPAARVRLTALAASGDKRHGEDLQVLLAPGVRDQVGLLGLGKGRALELESVAPGPTVLTLFDAQGFQVTHQLQLQPGADHTIEVPFALELPPGKVGLVLDESLAVLAVPPGSPAQQAGVRKGDVVLEVDGHRPENRNQAVDLLGGSPGTRVSVKVRRGQATPSLQIVRSTPGKVFPPKVTVTPQPAKKMPQLIQPAPGERVLAEAAGLDRKTEGPFRVDVAEAVAILDTLRAYVTLPGQIHQEDPEWLAVTVEGPNDLHATRKVLYYNQRTARVGCDPVVGGGPDQCGNSTWEEPTSPPPIEFGPDLLDTPGPHRLTVATPGYGEVQRTFLVVPYELGRAYQIHQHRELGSYRLQARAAVVVPSAVAGGRPLSVSRALFRSGDRTLIVDVSESGRPREEVEAVLSTGRWAQAPWVNARDFRAIKLQRRPDGFEAAWNADALVRVAGGQLGEAEQAVIDHYLSILPSRQPASR